MQSTPNFLTPGQVPGQAVSPVTTVSPVTRNQPTQRRGAKVRMCISVFQATLGTVLFVFGITVVSFNIPEERSINFSVTRLIDQRDKVSWGIWCGAIFIFTSVFGLFSKKNQAMISLYMAFSIVASLIAFCGTVALGIQLPYVSYARRDVDDELDNYYNYYFFHHSYNYFGNFRNPFGDLEDLNQVKRAVNIHLACYVIMLTCFVIEFFISIVGASFTCIGLDCCSSGPTTQRVIYYQPNGPQFTGHPFVVSPTQQYPVGIPLSGGSPMVHTTPVVHSTPLVMHGTPQSQNILNHAPPSYRSVVNDQNPKVRDDQNRQPPPGSPAFETTIPSDGAQGSDEESYITVTG